MRSSITLVLAAGAFLLAGASSSAFADKEVSVTAGTHGASVDYYKAEREKCKTYPGSDQARCMDQVGVTPYSGEREGTITAEMGSVNRCERLSGDDRRECMLNDRGG